MSSDPRESGGDDASVQGTTAHTARRLLDTQAASLSVEVDRALRQARADALAAARKGSRASAPEAGAANAERYRQGVRPLLDLGGSGVALAAMAAVLVLAVSVVWFAAPATLSRQPETTAMQAVDSSSGDPAQATPEGVRSAAPIALLAAEEGLEFYESVDFLLWLDSREG